MKTSSTKPEIHNALRHRHKKTRPWPQATCSENLVQFGRVFEIRELREQRERERERERDRDTLITIFRVNSVAHAA